ncbi:MAG: nucleotidyl transferase AbiEii/AbiGii toxin family protein [Clostridiales Family XIII bacterium]|nr:nucleotidyl transferase AbiEii/AbiGii toxin family protein [Clostridiales Family XIII bacterium]
MERLLERVSVSRYRDNFILKGGFLIAAMVGIDMRSTMDMDTTIKGVPVSQSEIESIVSEILETPVDDNVSFETVSIKPIHEAGEYKDFRLGILATFFTMRVNLKLDVTTGDVIIPREVDYSFKLMFEDRSVQVKAYNLNTILAEKIESILARNVANTRARDYYDVYILLTTRAGDIDRAKLLDALTKKAKERDTLVYIKQHEKYLSDIKESRDLLTHWNAYKSKYLYAGNIEFADVVKCLEGVF